MKKIVIIGPESTGKSFLCQQLAAHFNTLWVPEFARQYLEKNGTNYSYNDLLNIAKGQLELEDDVVKKLTTNTQYPIPHTSIPLFIDTDMYVMKVWCEFVFNKCHQWILDQIAERKYDFYLLCNIDLPWIKDELREYPDLESRKKLYCYYKDLLVNQSVPWAVVEGSYAERVQNAIRSVSTYLH